MSKRIEKERIGEFLLLVVFLLVLHKVGFRERKSVVFCHLVLWVAGDFKSVFGWSDF